MFTIILVRFRGETVIDVKTAVRSARNFISDLREVMENPLKNLRLEGIELSDDESVWLITFGYDVPNLDESSKIYDALSAMSSLTEPQKYIREYKVFKVETDSGQVKSMKIRTV